LVVTSRLASDFEVIKEGALLRKSDLAGSFKPRHFVCTKVRLKIFSQLFYD